MMKTANKIFSIIYLLLSLFQGWILSESVKISYVSLKHLHGLSGNFTQILSFILMIFACISLVLCSVLVTVSAFLKKQSKFLKILVVVWVSINITVLCIIPPHTYAISAYMALRFSSLRFLIDTGFFFVNWLLRILLISAVGPLVIVFNLIKQRSVVK